MDNQRFKRKIFNVLNVTDIFFDVLDFSSSNNGATEDSIIRDL